MAHLICGVDVSSQWLDIRIGPDGAAQRFSNTVAGVESLAALCRERKVTLVAMEATGGYEKLPFGLLWERGLPTTIINPREVRNFAKAMGLLEKTDKIDAGVIARFADVRGVVAQQPANKTQQRLTALVTRMRQLVELHAAQANQRRLVSDPDVLKATTDLMALIKSQIRSFEGKIAEIITEDPVWKAFDQAFRSIKGVADRTIARIIAYMPEIGSLSNKQVAKLAGLAPIAADSGKTNGRRHIQGGRSPVRDILFVIAECVRRHEPDFKAFYEKLTKAGKPKKVVKVALARKLLVRLNAKARDTRKLIALAP